MEKLKKRYPEQEMENVLQNYTGLVPSDLLEWQTFGANVDNGFLSQIWGIKHFAERFNDEVFYLSVNDRKVIMSRRWPLMNRGKPLALMQEMVKVWESVGDNGGIEIETEAETDYNTAKEVIEAKLSMNLTDEGRNVGIKPSIEVNWRKGVDGGYSNHVDVYIPGPDLVEGLSGMEPVDYVYHWLMDEKEEVYWRVDYGDERLVESGYSGLTKYVSDRELERVSKLMTKMLSTLWGVGDRERGDWQDVFGQGREWMSPVVEQAQIRVKV